jgi:hypothetical protein
MAKTIRGKLAKALQPERASGKTVERLMRCAELYGNMERVPEMRTPPDKSG